MLMCICAGIFDFVCARVCVRIIHRAYFDLYMGDEDRTRVCRSELLRVGQNRIYTPYMTVYLVSSLPKIPYIYGSCKP